MTPKAELFVDSRCELGEGPFWHPLLQRLFWFDILNRTLLSATEDGTIVDRITLQDVASAAAVIDRDTLAIAQAGSLLKYDLRTKTSAEIVPLEADLPGNRTNDSRVNLAGGFWIGTMGRKAERGVGSIYQYRAGTLTKILANRNIPNSTCFSPDGRTAYYTHTGDVIFKCTIDPSTGLPVTEWTPFVKLDGPGVADGSIVDVEGYLWNARWGGSSVLRIAPDGSIDRKVELPVSRVTCPALGGADLKTLYITSAREGLTPEDLEREPLAGSVFSIRVDVPGQPEPLLKL